ncbi:MAG: bifunctional folylpolyglutamate synthase/dihydrofolate synthase [Lachnospiraceae bacterium]|nr:bifunctional folylpolyglutamate synthase/dihydrofolate synthase [Lachnospiraceae bacterium]
MKIVLGLDTITELLNRLGNPHKGLRVIHVAGTNGKGSTITMLAQILMQAGYKVGTYTSPAVFDELEMFRINNDNISDEDYRMISTKVEAAGQSMGEDGLPMPTKFEIDTAIAFCYMHQSKCDIAIVETGMGGDLDSTNVCDSVVASVITSISLDHTSFLGDSLEEISTHKAGIIKKNCPVVLAYQSSQVCGVIEKKAISMEARYVLAPKHIRDTRYADATIALKGAYQQKNAATVIATIEVLRDTGYDIDDMAVRKGLAEAVWPGRFEIICRDPLFIVDGAHNPGAVEELKITLEEKYCDYKYVFIMGVLADKDYSTEIELMAGMAEYIVTVTPDNTRALSATDLARAVKEVNVNVTASQDVSDAVNIAIGAYDSIQGKKLILAFGSLSYIADIKESMERICR